mmetsp:Transcript_4406/g.11400  ORF Transcript_4406/g.11400 Transcript_4406/m.11400 type:complete len:285 (-) Transcript_4406:98-952(-)
MAATERTRLKHVWDHARKRVTSDGEALSESLMLQKAHTHRMNMGRTGKRRSTPMARNSRSATASLRPSRGCPMDASMPVTHVPTFAPSIRPADDLTVSIPCPARESRIDMVAPDDWIRPVTSVETRMPRAGLSILVSVRRKPECVFMNPKALLMRSMLKNIIPHPKVARPICLARYFLQALLARKPRNTMPRPRRVTLRTTRKQMSVDPTQAPSRMPMQLSRGMRSEETNSTRSTEMSDRLLVMPHATSPVRNPLTLFCESIRRIPRSSSPYAFLRPIPSLSMP